MRAFTSPALPLRAFQVDKVQNLQSSFAAKWQQLTRPRIQGRINGAALSLLDGIEQKGAILVGSPTYGL